MAREGFKKVLVVDDDKNTRFLCSEVLAAAGYRVDAAQDGMEALEMLRASGYDLVITDLNMPRLDGIAFYNGALREDPGYKDRFLFITGNLSDENRLAMKGFRKNCLYKPFRITELLSRIDSLLPVAPRTRARASVNTRQEERFSAISGANVLVEDLKNQNCFMARLEDFSRHGLKIRYDGPPVEHGTSVSICMNLNSMSIVRTVKVVWSKRTDGGADLASGLSFATPLPVASIMNSTQTAYPQAGAFQNPAAMHYSARQSARTGCHL